MQATAHRDIATLWLAWHRGEHEALIELMPRVYLRLSEITGQLLTSGSTGRSFDTSTVVQETYLRLPGLERIQGEARAHFYAMSARFLRRILVEQARFRSRSSRERALQRLETTELRVFADQTPPDVVQVDDAMAELATLDPQLAEIAEMRFFGGLETTEIAEVLDLPELAVNRKWFTARAWLAHHLAESVTPED